MRIDGKNERFDGRVNDELREVVIERGVIKHAEGSCIIWCGDTQVLAVASVEEKVPPHLRNSRTGWVTAEYSMLPRATSSRNQREVTKGHAAGRTMEIQRLIGRSLRSIVNLKELGERTITIDCDVIQADGGTRTASITASYIALYDALEWMKSKSKIDRLPLIDSLAAVSVGIVNNEPMLDLCYHEDSQANVDMNVVMSGSGKLIEVQGTAEGHPFSRAELNALLDLAEKGIKELTEKQKATLGI